MKLVLSGLTAVALLLAGQASAQQGIAPDSVTFAQVAALEGPAGALGQGMNLGLRAAFEEANRAGGVHGRMIRLDAFDDGYEPELSAAQTREVIAGDAHLALVGPVGTPTSQATQPLAAEAGLPFIGPFTGAAFLRNPALKNVFNVRASYDAETETWIRHLVDEHGMQNIAILFQDDGFGRAGLSGTVAALERRGMTLVAEAPFARNTTAVRGALLDLRRSKPDAVVMVGPYHPMAEFIRTARQVNFDATFVNISFVGTDAFVRELGAEGAGVIISQVVPYPYDISIPVVRRYTEALAALDPAATPGFVSLEGYLVGRFTLAALDAAGPELTRAHFLATLQGLRDVDIDGMVLKFGPGDNQGLDDVFLTVISPEGDIMQLGAGG